MRPRRGPWRALSFLLLALVLVQAHSYSLGEALRRFEQERVLPLARELRREAHAWQASLERAFGERGGGSERFAWRFETRRASRESASAQ